MDFIIKIYGFILYNLHRLNTIALGRYLSKKINGGGRVELQAKSV